MTRKNSRYKRHLFVGLRSFIHYHYSHWKQCSQENAVNRIKLVCKSATSLTVSLC